MKRKGIGQPGFSLTELLIVMSVMALMTALAGPNFLAMAARFDGQVAVGEVAAELRFARQLAIVHREQIRVVLEQGQSRLRTERVSTSGVTLRVYDLASKGLVVERFSGGSSILFHPNGRTATPATLVLRDRNRVGRTLTVNVVGKVSQS